MAHLAVDVVELIVHTSAGVVGRRLEFRDGLNVIRADNSSGKSTVLQAIIFGLGLEGMLSSSHSIPLPHAMTDVVTVGGREAAVVSSLVRLQVRNERNEVLSLQRHVKNPTIDSHLVFVSPGTLSDSGNESWRPYFVRRSGGATREAGFHTRLKEFIGWNLPTVTRFDGSEAPLYMECIFPYVYVEQKHGWSGVQARMPNYLGIRDASKRALEFLLGMKETGRVLTLQRLRTADEIMREQWKAVSQLLAEIVGNSGAVIGNPAAKIGAVHDSETNLVLFPGDEDGRWVTLDELINRLQARERTLSNEQFPSVESLAEGLEETLRQTQQALDKHAGLLAGSLDDHEQLEGRAEEIGRRIEALKQDLQRHKDSQTLVTLGADVPLIVEQNCPVCQRPLVDGLEVSGSPMSIEESINFIGRQLSMFQTMASETDRALSTTRSRVASLQETVRADRATVRDLKETLLARKSAPSLADVAGLVKLRIRIEELQALREEVSTKRDQLAGLSTEWQQVTERLKEGAGGGLTQEDMRTLQDLEARLKHQLEAYHFRSLPIPEVKIDPDTYRPAHDGFDLGFDISASDNIRIIWSYLLAANDTSFAFGGPHPGLLIFDEPRQQETEASSYGAFLREAARARPRTQIIVATSEQPGAIEDLLQGLACNLQSLSPGEKMLEKWS